MNYLHLILNIDKSLVLLISQYHIYIYIILFLIIFCETGLVVTPFLPGDSLLFVSGSVAATSLLNINLLIIIIFAASFCGDNTNYFIGKFIGKSLFKNPNSKIFKRSFLDKTYDFYAKHGKNTIIIARFIPIIRTFVPFVAGIGTMPYKKFMIFSIIASFLWILVLVGGGYLFGNIPLIKNNLSIVILIIMIISILPAIKIIIMKMRNN